MAQRILPTAFAALVALAPAAHADTVSTAPAPTAATACEFTVLRTTGAFTQFRSFPEGSFTVIEFPRRANTAPGGAFRFTIPNPRDGKLAPLTITREVTYTSNTGKLRTVKRFTRISRFDAGRVVTLTDLRISGTLVSQAITFISPRTPDSSYRCDHTTPTA